MTCKDDRKWPHRVSSFSSSGSGYSVPWAPVCPIILRGTQISASCAMGNDLFIHVLFKDMMAWDAQRKIFSFKTDKKTF